MKAFDKDELARAFVIPDPVRRSEFLSSIAAPSSKLRRPRLAMFIRLASAVLIIAEVIVIGVIMRNAPEGPDDIGLNSSVTELFVEPATGESTVTVTIERAAELTSTVESRTTTAADAAVTSVQTSATAAAATQSAETSNLEKAVVQTVNENVQKKEEVQTSPAQGRTTVNVTTEARAEVAETTTAPQEPAVTTVPDDEQFIGVWECIELTRNDVTYNYNDEPELCNAKVCIFSDGTWLVYSFSGELLTYLSTSWSSDGSTGTMTWSAENENEAMRTIDMRLENGVMECKDHCAPPNKMKFRRYDYIRGDVNHDGIVDNLDAQIILNVASQAGSNRLSGTEPVYSDEVLAEFYLYDYDLNGVIDGVDAALVLNHFSQMID